MNAAEPRRMHNSRAGRAIEHNPPLLLPRAKLIARPALPLRGRADDNANRTACLRRRRAALGYSAGKVAT